MSEMVEVHLKCISPRFIGLHIYSISLEIKLVTFFFPLCSMIAPLKFCSDFRPYFTIHDSEFKEYTTKTQAPWVIVYIIDW